MLYTLYMLEGNLRRDTSYKVNPIYIYYQAMFHSTTGFTEGQSTSEVVSDNYTHMLNNHMIKLLTNENRDKCDVP